MVVRWKLSKCSALVLAVNLLSNIPQDGVAAEAQPEGEDKNASAAADSNKTQKSRAREVCAPELGIVLEEKETFKTYAKNAQKFCNTSSPWAERHFKLREVLAFVGPWSDHGYRAARYFRGKVTHTSPLWFRILPGKKDPFEISGWDFAEEQVRWKEQAGGEFCHDDRCGIGPDILPHFSIEGFDKLASLRAMLEAPTALAAEIAVTCDRGAFQGIILDVRLALFPSLKSLLPALVKEIGKALHVAGRRFVLSVPAPMPNPGASDFGAEDATAVAPHVDAVVVGTRDFSRSTPGPAAPLPWVRSSLLRILADPASNQNKGGLQPSQVLMEIPMYGRAFQDGAADGKVIQTGEIVKALAKQKPKLVWNEEAAEHSANLSKSNVYLSFPSLGFFKARLQLAQSLGVGVALRDLSGGFDAAFDLLPTQGEKNEKKAKQMASEQVQEPDAEGVNTMKSEL